MAARDIVLEQIHHHETESIPYTLGFEAEVGNRIDEHFGNDDWRRQLVRYIAQCGSVASLPNEKLSETHHRDVFGTVWRMDKLPPVVVEPGVKAPTFQGYDFPSIDRFINPTAKANTKARVSESSDCFTIVSPTLCLWQGWYLRGFENTLIDCVAEEEFFD